MTDDHEPASCARCVPCPDCGAAYDCEPECPSIAALYAEDGTR